MIDIQHASEDVHVVLVGNKCDLDEERHVSKEEAQTFAIENGFKMYETSAKENINLDDAFIDVAKDILRYHNVRH